MTVAHVTFEAGFSGGEVQVFLLMEGLRKRGHRNVLLCPGGSAAEAQARRRGLETRAVPRRVRAVRRVLRELRPDLVHLHTGRANWLGGLAAWWLGIPAISTRRMDRRVKPGLRTRILYRTLLSRVAAIAPAVERRLVEGGVPPEKIRLIPSAVDPDALHPQRAIAKQGPVVLSAAALVRRKGIDVLLEAFARVGEAELWIAGDGPQRGALETRAKELGVAERVRFLGARDDVPDLLAACDVFVLPSRLEGLGVAALEAMAAAKPVVATRVGGLGEVVRDGECGLLVPPDDPAALAAALERLLGDPELRARLGAAGPARVAEGHLPEQLTDAYERLYREVLP